MSRLTAPLLTVALLGLAACGGDAASATTAPADADAVVRAQAGVEWDQSSYAATATDGKVVVTLINDSGQPHNLHIVDGDNNDIDKSAKEPEVSRSGDTSTATFTLAAGEYRVICEVPGHSNMNSKFVVA